MDSPEDDRPPTPEEIAKGRAGVEAIGFESLDIALNTLRRHVLPERWPIVREEIFRRVLEVERTLRFEP